MLVMSPCGFSRNHFSYVRCACLSHSDVKTHRPPALVSPIRNPPIPANRSMNVNRGRRSRGRVERTEAASETAGIVAILPPRGGKVENWSTGRQTIPIAFDRLFTLGQQAFSAIDRRALPVPAIVPELGQVAGRAIKQERQRINQLGQQ